MVIAIVIVIMGVVAIPTLPIATYPEVVPPVVQIIANLSRRQLAGPREDRRPADRAATGRARRHAVLLLAQLERRHAHHRRHLRAWHGHRSGDREDAEQSESGAAAVASRSAARRRDREEGVHRVSGGDRAFRNRQSLRLAVSQQFRRHQLAGQGRQHRRCGRYTASLRSILTGCASGSTRTRWPSSA